MLRAPHWEPRCETKQIYLRRSLESTLLAHHKFPPETQAENHTTAHAERPEIVHIAAFGHSHARMKSNRALDNRKPSSERRIQQMTIKLQIYTWIEHRKQPLQRFSPNHLISRSHVSERTLPQMFEFKQFAGEKISVVHESGKLRAIRAQLFDDPRPVHDLRVSE